LNPGPPEYKAGVLTTQPQQPLKIPFTMLWSEKNQRINWLTNGDNVFGKEW
jgi:hypothetical protein